MTDGETQKPSAPLKAVIVRIALFFLLSSAICHLSSAAHALPLIRDAEIEDTLRRFEDPILQEAGLNPAAVRIFIVNNDAINAYVAGGSNIFVHTGLILQADKPDMLLAVLAHETGHIAGGHLAQGAEKMRGMQLGAIMSYVASAAAAAAGGGQAAAAILTGSQQVLNRSLLSFSRANENAADQAALRYLDGLNTSSAGMLRMFELLRRHEQLRFGTPDPYAMTHPLSTERIGNVRSHLDSSKLPSGKIDPSLAEPHARMVAKLRGFLDLPTKTLARYPASDRSIPAQLARAVAHFRMAEPDKALAEMDALLKERPNDAFLYDMQGQILFENGRVADALIAYRKAASIKPNSAQILTALGEALIANNSIDQAVSTLEKATSLDNSNSRTWRLLATAYGRKKDMGRASLALAEKSLLDFEPEDALAHASRALDTLDAGSPARLRAEDVKRQAQEMKDKKDEPE